MAAKSAPWLTECDPISLEPLRLLRYPPFECRADLSLSHCVASDWFDGRVLASYLVSTGNFTHPISRRELTRADELNARRAHAHLRGGGDAQLLDGAGPPLQRR